MLDFECYCDSDKYFDCGDCTLCTLYDRYLAYCFDELGITSDLVKYIKEVSFDFFAVPSSEEVK